MIVNRYEQMTLNLQLMWTKGFRRSFRPGKSLKRGWVLGWKYLKFWPAWQQKSDNPATGSDWQAQITWKQCRWCHSGIDKVCWRSYCWTVQQISVHHTLSCMTLAANTWELVVIPWSGSCWKGNFCM